MNQTFIPAHLMEPVFIAAFDCSWGVRVNLSRSGVSTSIGGRNAHVTVGHGKGVRQSDCRDQRSNSCT